MAPQLRQFIYHFVIHHLMSGSQLKIQCKRDMFVVILQVHDTNVMFAYILH